MKKLLLLVLLTGFSYAQNADGENISFHFTPFITIGSLTFDKATLLMLNNQGYEEEMILTYEPSGNMIPILNYQVMLKVPVNNFTFSPFLNSHIIKYKDPSYKSTRYDIGCRISFYLK